VLLSVAAYYKRTYKGENKREVCFPLGHVSKDKETSLRNSFAVPYPSRPSWFLDPNYVNNMMDMFHKVNVQEKIIGWCSTGPIVPPTDLGIPTEACISVEGGRWRCCSIHCSFAKRDQCCRCLGGWGRPLTALYTGWFGILARNGINLQGRGVQVIAFSTTGTISLTWK
jgi:hypothetical protein